MRRTPHPLASLVAAARVTALVTLGACGAPSAATPDTASAGPLSDGPPVAATREGEALDALLAPPAPGDRPTPSDVGLLTQAPGLRITLLANGGFLLRSDEAAVLIDAFDAASPSNDDALPPAPADDLLAARPPFDDVSMALVSHVHRDRALAPAARAFLAASPDTQLVSTPQVVAAIEAGAADGEVDGSRLQPLLPPPGKSFDVTRRGVTVELLNLPHGAGPPEVVQNLGFVVTLGALRVVHLGGAAIDDGDLKGGALAAYAPAVRGLDVALVPYWFFLDPDGRRLVEQHLPARLVIACHVPFGERDALAAELARSDPDVIVPERSTDSWSLDPAGP